MAAFKKSSLTNDIYTVVIELEHLYVWKQPFQNIIECQLQINTAFSIYDPSNALFYLFHVDKVSFHFYQLHTVHGIPFPLASS